ncbi:Axin-related protein [Harpegnathos saltator]|uniref:Axin-related protein n=2 Tax=Harpegnathos saltator TaxID=610380 RepID=E2C7U7_HARSA|nr:Axin-related protein [Harpegnathos saltator]
MSASRQNEARCFNENSPRPPVPGEETGSYVSRIRPQSPALTPRRSSFATPTVSGGCDASAPLGFEPEGCCGTTTMESDSPPAYVRWARNLHSLLEDPVGLELFKRYLDQEGHVDPLNFWFACEGLKEQKDMEKISQLVKLIYRRFFLKSQLTIPEDVMKEADRRVKEGRADQKVFDIVQLEVERLINETTYPNFLQSDVYLQYVQSCQNPDSGGCPSSGSSREMSLSCGPSLLPTLHEDSEFVSSMHNSHSASETPGEFRELRLTKDILMATQQSRAMDVRPKPEMYAGIYLQRGASPYHMHVSRLHAQYSSYNPVSRQDSELQSLSSDARTEVDNMSLTDGSVDGASSRQRSKKQYAKQSRTIKESASVNRDPMAHHIVPRTQRVPSHLSKPMTAEQFMHKLCEKLEIVARERKTQEKLDKHLQEDDLSGNDVPLKTISNTHKTLGDALREKLSVEEDSDQAILDEHVSRVWSDQTPLRSPRLSSPRLHSPERRRGPAHNYPRPYKQRKEKDVFSTFSVDSGNIHDFQEGSDLVGAGSMSSLGSHLPKSKSVPSDYADSLHKQDLYVQGHEQRFRRSDMTRRSATKKSMTELTDSGVSVVSDVPPSISKDTRLLPRFKETDKKMDLKHSSRHGKRYGSRSGSLERQNRETWSVGVPAQPFVADPGMPPLTPPHTVIQLEETCRRLGGYLEESSRARTSCKQRHLNASKQTYEPASQGQPYVQSNQSTLRKTKQDDFTTVVFSFCDEQFPYRTKIPGHNVTLKQFKEYLPKKGSYRYFFKTECEDLDTRVIQEEITDDAEVLPLWEGKVMAQVKALE